MNASRQYRRMAWLKDVRDLKTYVDKLGIALPMLSNEESVDALRKCEERQYEHAIE